MDSLPRIHAVFSLGSGQLAILFRSGEAKRFDVSAFMDKPVFQPLRDGDEFDAVTIVEPGIGIEWPCGADLSAMHLYNVGEPMKGHVLQEATA